MYIYKYPRPAVTVDALVYTKKNEILLIRRGNEPFKGKWALPGGFVDMDELLEMACIRELKEETGLHLEKMQQFKIFDEIDRDPRHRTISIVFTAEVPKKYKVEGGDDAAKAGWFPVSDLPPLGFDHQKIIGEFFRNP